MHVHMKSILPQQLAAPSREPAKPSASAAPYASEVQHVTERRNGEPGRGSQGRPRPQPRPDSRPSDEVNHDPSATLAKTLAALDLAPEAEQQEPDRPDAGEPSLDDLLLGAVPASER